MSALLEQSSDLLSVSSLSEQVPAAMAAPVMSWSSSDSSVLTLLEANFSRLKEGFLMSEIIKD